MIGDFIHLIFPQTCVCCEEVLPNNKKFLCPVCTHLLPFAEVEDDALLRKFAGRIQVKDCFSYLKFNKTGMVQKLLHALKYQDKAEIGSQLGADFYQYLKKNGKVLPPDGLIPVPLHPERLKKRGYNQSEEIAKGLVSSTDVPVLTDCLIRVKDNSTQTKKGRTARLENMLECFSAEGSSLLKGKYVGLVDDVITTGATLEACFLCLEKAGVSGVSIFSLAYA